MRKILTYSIVICLQSMGTVWAGELIYPPIVPPNELEEARSLQNPLLLSPDDLDQGKTLYEGRVFCMACHGKDGKGLPPDKAYATSGFPVPRDFTDPDWQNARADGELFWVLTQGSHGTDMASFLPMYLSEQEAWQLIMYIRTFGKFSDKL